MIGLAQITTGDGDRHKQDNVLPSKNNSFPSNKTQIATEGGDQQKRDYVLPSNNNTLPSNKTGKKKFYLIHIGPSKTATSTIQMDSSMIRNPDVIKALKKDNTLTVGRYTLESGYWRANRCMEKIIHNAKIKSTKLLLLDCWKGNEEALQMNIIHSDESFSYKANFIQRKVDNVKAIYLKYFDYDEVIVVGAYRRYGEWLASVYSQWAKNKCLESEIWPTEMDVVTSHKPSCQNIWTYIKRHIIAPDYNAIEKEYHNIDETLGGLSNYSSEVM